MSPAGCNMRGERRKENARENGKLPLRFARVKGSPADFARERGCYFFLFFLSSLHPSFSITTMEVDTRVRSRIKEKAVIDEQALIKFMLDFRGAFGGGALAHTGVILFGPRYARACCFCEFFRVVRGIGKRKKRQRM